MRYKPKTLKTALLILLVTAALLAAINLLGLGTMRSGVRLGYVEKGRWGSWSASYARMDGTFWRTLRPGDAQNTLHVEVETQEGKLSLTITDKDGKLILEEEDVGTTAFDVPASGKVVVRIEADKHRGSFQIGFTQ